MFDFEEFEEDAGHDLTMVQGTMAGRSTYYCEGCGALVQVGQNDRENDALILFHVPIGSLSTEKKCARAETSSPHTTLKIKLKKLDEESYERLKRI